MLPNTIFPSSIRASEISEPQEIGAEKMSLRNDIPSIKFDDTVVNLVRDVKRNYC